MPKSVLFHGFIIIIPQHHTVLSDRWKQTMQHQWDTLQGENVLQF